MGSLLQGDYNEKGDTIMGTSPSYGHNDESSNNKLVSRIIDLEHKVKALEAEIKGIKPPTGRKVYQFKKEKE